MGNHILEDRRTCISVRFSELFQNLCNISVGGCVYGERIGGGNEGEGKGGIEHHWCFLLSRQTSQKDKSKTS